LVTLIGPGGIGKTRLALQVAAGVLPEFKDGVFLVPLAPLRDPALVSSAIAAVLGIKETPGQSLHDTVREYLRAKQLLLVLDNFEHLPGAGSLVTELLEASRCLHVLVTSRERLRLYGEHEFLVPPLALPNGHLERDIHALACCEAVALFIDRVQAMRPDFALTNEDAQAVAKICVTLEGLPLAIELAAARMRSLNPPALLRRLEHRLRLLTKGAQDLHPRLQSVRAAIDWSHDLLDAHEQRLFARLSVFAGGCTLEAAQAICGCGEEGDVVPGLTSLVDKSLLRQEMMEPRFVMLETIREYAAERLEACGEADCLRRQHLDHFLAMAEQDEPTEEDLMWDLGTGAARWSRIQADRDNVHAALQWAFERRQAELGLRLASALASFWHDLAGIGEGRRWLEVLLGLVPKGSILETVRAKALDAAGTLAWQQGDYPRAQALHQEALALQRKLGNTRKSARSLGNLGVLAHLQGDSPRAQQLLEESLDVFRAMGDRWNTALQIENLGVVVYDHGDHERGEALYRECLALYREVGLRPGALLLYNLGEVALDKGDAMGAASLYREALASDRNSGRKPGMSSGIEFLAWAAASIGDTGRAIRLFAAAANLREDTGVTLPPHGCQTRALHRSCSRCCV
jgi:predicted ATPase